MTRLASQKVPRYQLIVITVIYVLGGLAEEVDEKVLHAAFVPFGDLLDIQIPIDYETGEWQNPVV